jgi:hypothetical protein
MIFLQDSNLVNIELVTLSLHTYNIHYLTPENSRLPSKTRKYDEFAVWSRQFYIAFF